MTNENLFFLVAPHIVQDLGINLYTTLPRVIVEFVANAHDADSPDVDVQMDFAAIRQARKELRATRTSESRRIEDAELPEHHVLRIIDTGHGMSREDMQMRFLVAGRRRRDEDNSVRSPGNRILMGRKGLGKLAGFGVAKRVTVTSRRLSDDYATRVVLDYDQLVASPAERRIPVPTETLETGLPPPGTEVALSRLVFEPVKSRPDTIMSALANHYRFVGTDDFVIKVNGQPVQLTDPDHAFAWPRPEDGPGELCEAEVMSGSNRRRIKYRVRFTEKSLPARDRGVRIYASGRMASAPDLLDLPTGMHGFRLTDYIDAIAIADFIDEESTEYIATDRRSLRWETHFLQGLREFLTNEMKQAVVAYQRHRDQQARSDVHKDVETKQIIASARLSSWRRKTAMEVATALAKVFPDGISDPEYTRNLRILTHGLGQGTVLQNLADLAGRDLPGFNALSEAVVELTLRETGELARFAEGRIDAIEAFQKIVRDVDFSSSNNEKELQRLFESAPWLIGPVFTQAVTANKWVSTTYDRLARFLRIREYAAENDRKRADLVFLVSTVGGNEITIVELKAANEMLNHDHLVQLEQYIRKAERFLYEHGSQNVLVRGILIGSRNSESSSEKVEHLNWRINANQESAKWQVRDIIEVLELTEHAHQELIRIYASIEETNSE